MSLRRNVKVQGGRKGTVWKEAVVRGSTLSWLKDAKNAENYEAVSRGDGDVDRLNRDAQKTCALPSA